MFQNPLKKAQPKAAFLSMLHYGWFLMVVEKNSKKKKRFNVSNMYGKYFKLHKPKKTFYPFKDSSPQSSCRNFDISLRLLHTTQASGSEKR